MIVKCITIMPDRSRRADGTPAIQPAAGGRCMPERSAQPASSHTLHLGGRAVRLRPIAAQHILQLPRGGLRAGRVRLAGRACHHRCCHPRLAACLLLLLVQHPPALRKVLQSRGEGRHVESDALEWEGLGAQPCSDWHAFLPGGLRASHTVSLLMLHRRRPPPPSGPPSPHLVGMVDARLAGAAVLALPRRRAGQLEVPRLCLAARLVNLRWRHLSLAQQGGCGWVGGWVGGGRLGHL